MGADGLGRQYREQGSLRHVQRMRVSRASSAPIE